MSMCVEGVIYRLFIHCCGLKLLESELMCGRCDVSVNVGTCIHSNEHLHVVCDAKHEFGFGLTYLQ